LKYHVTCSNPGMHRGGRSNPAHKDYALGDHTPAQLRELLADPHTAVVIGEPMTEAHIVAMEEAAKAEAPPKEAEAVKPEAVKPDAATKTSKKA
jgi:hypothetical protein